MELLHQSICEAIARYQVEMLRCGDVYRMKQLLSDLMFMLNQYQKEVNDMVNELEEL